MVRAELLPQAYIALVDGGERLQEPMAAADIY